MYKNRAAGAKRLKKKPDARARRGGAAERSTHPKRRLGSGWPNPLEPPRAANPHPIARVRVGLSLSIGRLLGRL